MKIRDLIYWPFPRWPGLNGAIQSALFFGALLGLNRLWNWMLP